MLNMQLIHPKKILLKSQMPLYQNLSQIDGGELFVIMSQLSLF